MSLPPLNECECGIIMARRPNGKCKCGRAMSVLVMDGHTVTPADAHKDAERAEMNRQDRLKRKIKPGTEDRLFTSTLNKDKPCEK